MWRALILCGVATTALSQPIPNAKSVLVVDVDTQTVLFTKNSDDVRPIASITKLMGALVVMESGQPLDEQIAITAEDVGKTTIRKRATGATLQVGAVLTRRELLQLSLMNSQNRAAYALGRSYPGGVDNFVFNMNAIAERLGMTHTKFTDPTGLQNTNVSTTEDLAKLVSIAATHSTIRELSTAVTYNVTRLVNNREREIGFRTTNALARQPDWNLILQKTGYINDSGRCVAMMMMIGTRRVVMVLLNTPSNSSRVLDAVNIRRWIEQVVVMPQDNPPLPTLSPGG